MRYLYHACEKEEDNEKEYNHNCVMKRNLEECTTHFV